jgi:hypothetical protein
VIEREEVLSEPIQISCSPRSQWPEVGGGIEAGSTEQCAMMYCADCTGSGLFEGLSESAENNNNKRLMKFSVGQGLEGTRLAGAIAHDKAPVEASQWKALPYDPARQRNCMFPKKEMTARRGRSSANGVKSIGVHERGEMSRPTSIWKE